MKAYPVVSLKDLAIIELVKFEKQKPPEPAKTDMSRTIKKIQDYQLFPRQTDKGINQQNLEHNKLCYAEYISMHDDDLTNKATNFESRINEIHIRHQDKINELRNQLDDVSQKLELANRNIEFLIKAKKKRKDALFYQINAQVQQAKIDLECVASYMDCFNIPSIQDKQLYETQMKKTLASHDEKLFELVNLFDKAQIDLKYLEQLKSDQDKIFNELKADKDKLKLSIQDFEEKNLRTFQNLKLLIYEKETLVRKLDDKEKSLERLQEKYSDVLRMNTSLKIDLDDAKLYLGLAMRKELEECDQELLIIMMNYVVQMCAIQDELNETENEIKLMNETTDAIRYQ